LSDRHDGSCARGAGLRAGLLAGFDGLEGGGRDTLTLPFPRQVLMQRLSQAPAPWQGAAQRFMHAWNGSTPLARLPFPAEQSAKHRAAQASSLREQVRATQESAQASVEVDLALAGPARSAATASADNRMERINPPRIERSLYLARQSCDVSRITAARHQGTRDRSGSLTGRARCQCFHIGESFDAC
jgi:hypothetical protein